MSIAFELPASQTVLNESLQDLTRYSSAAATLIAKAVIGVNGLDAAEIPKSNRIEVRDELRKISFAMSTLLGANRSLVFDLSGYVDKVRTKTLDAEQREFAWKAILRNVENVSPIVRTTLNVVEESRWLKVTLDEQDRLALRQTLLSRGMMLDRFRSLPVPSTANEIDQLEEMIKFYRQLMTSLSELNVALARATERLKLE